MARRGDLKALLSYFNIKRRITFLYFYLRLSQYEFLFICELICNLSERNNESKVKKSSKIGQVQITLTSGSA